MFSCELPLNGDPIAVCAPIPGFGLTAQLGNVCNPASSQALSAEKTDLYLGLIQPASMRGRVVYGKAIPQPSTNLAVQNLNRGLVKAESGQRGFLLTSKAGYLDSYLKGSRAARPSQQRFQAN